MPGEETAISTIRRVMVQSFWWWVPSRPPSWSSWFCGPGPQGRVLARSQRKTCLRNWRHCDANTTKERNNITCHSHCDARHSEANTVIHRAQTCLRNCKVPHLGLTNHCFLFHSTQVIHVSECDSMLTSKLSKPRSNYLKGVQKALNIFTNW